MLNIITRKFVKKESLSIFRSNIGTVQNRNNSSVVKGRAPTRVKFDAKITRKLPFQRGEPDRVLSPHEPNNQFLLDAKVRPQILREYLDPVPVIQEDDPYGFEQEITVERLFRARVHFGHKIGTLNENMKWAIYGERLGVCIFDLDITRQYMVRALNFIAALSYTGGRFLFITTNKYAMLLVEEIAAELGEYSNTRFWHHGTLMNKEVPGGPIRLPDTIIFLNVLTSQMLERHPAIVEAAKMCIPTVGIIDSNCEPNYISFPIPGNDDTLSSLEFYMGMFARAIKLGRKSREEATEKLNTTTNLHNGQRQHQQRNSLPIQPPDHPNSRS